MPSDTTRISARTGQTVVPTWQPGVLAAVDAGLDTARGALLAGLPVDAIAALDSVWEHAKFAEAGWYLRAAALLTLGLPGESERVVQEGITVRPSSVALRHLESLARQMLEDADDTPAVDARADGGQVSRVRPLCPEELIDGIHRGLLLFDEDAEGEHDGISPSHCSPRQDPVAGTGTGESAPAGAVDGATAGANDGALAGASAGDLLSARDVSSYSGVIAMASTLVASSGSPSAAEVHGEASTSNVDEPLTEGRGARLVAMLCVIVAALAASAGYTAAAVALGIGASWFALRQSGGARRDRARGH